MTMMNDEYKKARYFGVADTNWAVCRNTSVFSCHMQGFESDANHELIGLFCFDWL